MISSPGAQRPFPSIPLDVADNAADDRQHRRRPVCFHVAAPLAHGLRDLAGQCGSKIAGAGVFLGAAAAAGDVASVIEMAVPVAGGLAGFDIGYKIARHQFGRGVAGRAAVALCALGTAAAGAAVASGNVAAVTSVVAAGFTFSVPVAHFKLSSNYEDRSIPAPVQALIGVGALAVGGFCGALVTRAEPEDARRWFVTDDYLMPRQIGAAAEAVGVELCKELFASLGPFVDRRGLTLEGRIISALKGLPAYVAAGMLINRLGAELVADPQHTLEFDTLAPVVLIGCLPNLVRGTANALAVLHSWGKWHRDDVAGQPWAHARADKPMRELATSVLDKAVVRWMLILPRNVAFQVLLRHGYSVGSATLITQGAYALYAQFRDVLPDFMAGDGWTPQ
jgi:hypothetical protein